MFLLPLDSLGDLQVNSTSSPFGHFLTSYALLASNNNFYDTKEIVVKIEGESICNGVKVGMLWKNDRRFVSNSRLKNLRMFHNIKMDLCYQHTHTHVRSE